MSEDSKDKPNEVVKVVDFTAKKDTTSEDPFSQTSTAGVIAFPVKSEISPLVPHTLTADSPILSGSFSFIREKTPLPSEVIASMALEQFKMTIGASNYKTSLDLARDDLEETLIELTRPTGVYPSLPDLYDRQQKVFEKMLALLQQLKPRQR